MIIDTPYTGIVIILIGALGLFCPIMLAFHLKGKLRAAESWLILGVLFVFLALLALVLVDFGVMEDTFSHRLIKIFLVLSAVMAAIGSRKMCNLIKNIPQSMLDKINK